jgi:hypothetical protein
MNDIIELLEKKLLDIIKRKECLERKLASKHIGLASYRQVEDWNSELWWLGSLSGKIKNDIIEYKDLDEKIKLTNDGEF